MLDRSRRYRLTAPISPLPFSLGSFRKRVQLAALSLRPPDRYIWKARRRGFIRFKASRQVSGLHGLMLTITCRHATEQDSQPDREGLILVITCVGRRRSTWWPQRRGRLLYKTVKPDEGLGFQVKVLQTFSGVPSSLGRSGVKQTGGARTNHSLWAGDEAYSLTIRDSQPVWVGDGAHYPRLSTCVVRGSQPVWAHQQGF